MSPDRLGPYAIGKPLGKGGMGTVFAAVEESTGDAAAVKVLFAALGREEGFRERFAAEIESLRKLRHPNIVRLLGYGVEADLEYYAMELVEGRSLEEELRSGRKFGWREVVELGLQITRALRHAHDRGVIHRDVKPANLLMAPDGTLKLSDFGIAKLFGNTGLTSSGGVVGTAEFMSPEQADGRPVTHRCDLYSFGLVLYTLLAGRPPFRGTSVVDVLQKQRYSEAEPLRKSVSLLPSELEELIVALMHKEPERRVPTALAVCRRLELIRDLPDPAATIPPTKKAPEVGSGPDEVQTADDLADHPSNEMPPTQDPHGKTAKPRHRASGDMLTTALPSMAAKPNGPVTTSKFTLGGGERRFTAVDRNADEWIDSESWGEKAVGLVSPGTWVIIAALTIVGLTTWYLVQPPSADHLYQQITAAVQNDRIDNGAKLDANIKTFLSYYPGDPRSREVEGVQNELNRWLLARRMDRLARRATEAGQLTPVQAGYLEALRFETLDPERCRDLLQALVDVYSGDTDQATDDRLILELSRRKIVEIAQRLRTVTDLEAVSDRIERIAVAAQTDEADAITKLRGLRTLLQGKLGAEDQRARIDELLAELTAPARP